MKKSVIRSGGYLIVGEADYVSVVAAVKAAIAATKADVALALYGEGCCTPPPESGLSVCCDWLVTKCMDKHWGVLTHNFDSGTFSPTMICCKAAIATDAADVADTAGAAGVADVKDVADAADATA